MSKRKAVISIVNYNGKILLGKKRANSGKFMAGKWHLPGENIEEGESDEQALVRGVFEETGVRVRVGKFLGNYPTPTGKSANFYECFVLTDKISIGSDLEDAKWVSKTEVLEYCKDRVNLWPKEVREYFK